MTAEQIAASLLVAAYIAAPGFLAWAIEHAANTALGRRADQAASDLLGISDDEA